MVSASEQAHRHSARQKQKPNRIIFFKRSSLFSLFIVEEGGGTVPVNTAAIRKGENHLLSAVMFCQYYNNKAENAKEERIAIGGTELSFLWESAFDSLFCGGKPVIRGCLAGDALKDSGKIIGVAVAAGGADILDVDPGICHHDLRFVDAVFI